MSRLTKLLAPGAVELQGGVEHWREAICLADGLLENSGNVMGCSYIGRQLRG